ncbi:hypothetical protein N0B16_07945 [Chryseobacterium sp. GMJ5]|uniref:Uncharacterized protein n=1 Tax=Chryseobacterium gilvum TaxID=2976534 RepID=A0ABT2VWK2_9FLAO|nr:hypothetical protein [Chryseobacterium gilvum]MCU7614367.1 hypothetical protein [Chryseobacterium gilvum]
MPKLNEYLGGLVSEIASARKMADLQTVEIAKEYAKDDLLKHFSIPRMKIGSVDLTVPFAQAGNSVKMSFKEFVYDEITTVAKEAYESAGADDDKMLKNVLAEYEYDYNKIASTIDRASLGSHTAIDEDHPLVQNKTFDELSKRIISFCSAKFEWPQNADLDLLWLSIRNRTISEYQKNTGSSMTDNDVIVEASQLMKIDPKYLIYAKMSVTESGMEWSRYEDINGNPVETLIPE